MDMKKESEIGGGSSNVKPEGVTKIIKQDTIPTYTPAP